mmetsp:Transcript_10439/g.18399  ORF Transcript_10439/g.18399 Transcript_10439/m.18399 type:complete len:209 (-) Transcript_10439:919-1545(-)
MLDLISVLASQHLLTITTFNLAGLRTATTTATTTLATFSIASVADSFIIAIHATAATTAPAAATPLALFRGTSSVGKVAPAGSTVVAVTPTSSSTATGVEARHAASATTSSGRAHHRTLAGTSASQVFRQRSTALLFRKSILAKVQQDTSVQLETSDYIVRKVARGGRNRVKTGSKKRLSVLLAFRGLSRGFSPVHCSCRIRGLCFPS